MDTFADEQLRYRIALAAIKGMNRLLAEKLIELTGDVSVFFTLSQKELSHLTGLDSSLFSEVERGRVLRMASDEVEFIRKKGITPLFLTDNDYPQRLLECDDAPIMISVKKLDTSSILFPPNRESPDSILNQMLFLQLSSYWIVYLEKTMCIWIIISVCFPKIRICH